MQLRRFCVIIAAVKFERNTIMNEENLVEKKVSSEDIFKGYILHVEKDMVSLPNGNTASRELIRHIGAVCVVPVTDGNEVIIERQFRYPIDQVITEIPAGKLDASNDDVYRLGMAVADGSADNAAVLKWIHEHKI